MAGKDKKGIFREKISPFLENKISLLKQTLGAESEEYRALYLQYTRLDEEDNEEIEDNNRHWEADMPFEDQAHGIERLYNKTAVIEPTMVCASHCRYCLRSNYNIFTLSEEEIIKIAQFCGSDQVKDNIYEVLITGGDPLVLPNRLNFLVNSLINYAPNIKIMRVATRVPLHDPARIDNNVYEIFRKYSDKVRFELATQINHPVDLFPETIDVFRNFLNMGIPVYSQNVLLKNINDNINTLVGLYNKMREHGIESHYLFHCVPMRGMHHYRTTVSKGLRLAKELTNSGLISGRVKPMYALMTDIGKITLYDGTILEKDEKRNMILVQSNYKYEERLRNNQTWKLPENAEVDDNGLLRIWYLDGTDS